MELLTFLLPLFLSTTSVVASTPLTTPQICFKACYSAVMGLKFTTSPPSKGEGMRVSEEYMCSSHLPISSMYACYAAYCNYPTTPKNFYQQNLTCGGHMPGYSNVMARVDVHTLPVANASNPKMVYDTTTLPPKAKVMFLNKQYTTMFHMRHLNHVYTWSLYTIIACIAAVTVLVRIAGALSKGRLGALSIFTFIRRHVTLPAAFGHKHAEASALGKIPTRVESLLVFAYVAANVILCCVNYPAHLGKDPGFIQNWDRLSDRSCALATGNLPIAFLFAGRNNLLIWMTGVDYSTFNLFHRWTARVLTVEALLHAIAHTVDWTDYGGWSWVALAWKQQYLWCGAIAFFSMIFLSITGNYQIRKRTYEIFLIIHIPLAMAALVGMFYHVKVTHGAHDPYLWPCAGFWIFDRFIRICRIAWAAFFTRSTTAMAIYDKESDMIRLFVRAQDIMGRNLLGPAPGQHYFIHTSTGILGMFENHPFSLMGWNKTAQSSTANEKRSVSNEDVDLEKANERARARQLSREDTTITVTPVDEKRKELELGDKAIMVVRSECQSNCREISSPTSGSTSETSSINGDTQSLGVVMTRGLASDISEPTPAGLQFMLKPHSGMTYRLREQILKSDTNSVKFRVAIEGPYGHRHNFKSFDRVLLIAGGSGITALVPYARELSATSVPQKTKLLWSTRTYQKSYARELLGDISDATVYVTSGTMSTLTLDEMEGVDMRQGRIDLARMIAEEMMIMEEDKRLAVVCCGPGRMCDDVRSEVVKSLGGRVQVEYFEENFGW